MPDIHSVVKLLKNHIYPTYQLYATMTSKKTSPEEGLVLGVLTVLSWLRQRMGEEIPQEAMLPEPDCFREVRPEQLLSFHVNHGYVVDVVSLPEEGLWTLQIVEPDLGSDPGNPQQSRRPVAGRILETDVGFCIKNMQLQCGVKTVVSDPENTAPAPVYRPAFVKRLYNNPNFGLQQCRHIQPNVNYINTLEDLKKLEALLEAEDNQLLSLVFTKPKEYEDEDKLPLESLPLETLSIKHQEDSEIEGWPVKPIVVEDSYSHKEAEKKKKQQSKDRGKRPVVSSFAELRLLSQNPLLAQEKPLLPKLQQRPRKEKYVLPSVNIHKLAASFAAYAHVFLLHEKLFAKFTASHALPLREGEAVLLEPKCFGGGSKIYATAIPEAEKFLRKDVFVYPRGKAYRFGDIFFLAGARDALVQGKVELQEQSASQLERWQIEMLALQKQYEAKLEAEHSNYAKLEAKNSSLKQQITLEENKSKALREAQQKLADEHQQVLTAKDAYIAFLQRQVSRPHTKKELPDWVSKVHGEHLLLHPRALQTLEAASVNADRLELIYDALDYMATDYWESRYGKLSNEELLNLSSQKYHRAFEITPCKGTTLDVYSQQYHIPYFKDEMGRIKASELNFHLKAGNKAEHLVRIYFLFDDAKKLIVVGSLPEHLQTVSIS